MLENYAQHPIFLVIISFFIVVLVITESILREKLLKNRLFFSFLNITFSVVLIFFYETVIMLNKDYLLAYVIYLYFVYGIFLIALYQTFRNANINASYYQLFIKGLKHTKWNVYYVVDQKDRIKDISQSLLRELNLDREEVIGKKLLSILQSKIRVTKINGEDINPRALEKALLNYRKSVNPNEMKEVEVHFQNFNGETIVINLSMQPLYMFGRYRGHMSNGQKLTEEALMAVERELRQTDSELESIRHKFIATLELSDEGLFFIDLDEKTIWINDTLKEALKLPNHTLNLSDYRTLIESQDLPKYTMMLSDLTPNKPNYSVSYRILVDGVYIWIKEKGKKLFEDKNSSTIMGIMSPVGTNHFRKTSIATLDEIKDENHLLPDLKLLINSKRPFQLAILSLKNIPKINELYGRNVGNMLMAQYITKIKSSFVTESSQIYRISGLEFAVTITDPRKMSIIQNGIRAEDNYLNLEMQYGSITAEVEVFIGVAQMFDDAVNAQELFQNANQALKTAQLPQFKGHGCYYKDIK